MRTYRPGKVDAKDENSLRREFEAIQEAANRAEPYMQLQVLHAAPNKTFGGMLILVDGVDFNPGSGAGLYRRTENNASWVFVG